MRGRLCQLSTLGMLITVGVVSSVSAQQNHRQFESSELNLTLRGTTSFRNPIGSGIEAELFPNRSKWDQVHYLAHRYGRELAKNSPFQRTLSTPVVTPLPVIGPGPGFTGFAAINGAEQAALEGFDLEPPDQGLCTDGKSVLEIVNLAAAVYSPKGKVLAGPVGLNSFFGTSGFLSDPRCYYDPPTQRWFWSITDVETPSYVLLAVSASSDPAGSYSVYAIDTTNDGLIGACPCFGDQPLLGADTNGLYISTNAFSLVNSVNPQAQIYALSKFALAAGFAPIGVHLVPLPGPGEPYPFSLGPALSPNGQGPTANGGIEYFLASDQDANEADDVVLWALTNTSSLGPLPELGLTSVVVSTQAYEEPPPGATQKKGPIPLGNSVGVTTVGQLDTDDDRMSMPLYWADGKLWSAVNTAVQLGSNTLAGIAYFILEPSWKKGVLNGSVTQQGYVVAQGPTGPDNTIYPAIGVTESGAGAMVFTLTGPDYFPSAAYISIDTKGTGSAVRLAGKGVGPDDGFSIYPAFGGSGIGRWGDYSWAVAPNSSTVWIATEYIGSKKRDKYTNWGTFIGSVPLP